MQKLLGQLLPAFNHELVACDCKTPVQKADIYNIPITSLEFDSRKVTQGSLYFALPGTHVNGNNFISQAIQNGANAIVFEGELSDEIQQNCAKLIAKRQLENALKKENSIPDYIIPAFIKVENARFCMSPISDTFYDSPSKRLIVIGVTGTEGKSSTVSFIWQLLRCCGKKAGFISTVEYSFGGPAQANPEHQTTPEAPIIQNYLNQMLENGCEYAVVESSSHGLSSKLNRLGNVLFDTAVFMNVTLEHLEFHKTFEQYKADKTNLFKALDKHNHIKTIAGETKKIPSIGIVNLEDASFKDFVEATKKHVYGFTTLGMAGKAAAEKGLDAVSLPEIPKNFRYMTAQNIASARYGIDFTIDADGTNSKFESNYDPVLPRKHTHLKVQAKISGAFNAYNIMAAIIAVSSVTEFDFEEICTKIPELNPIKGRMTVIEQGQPFEVIVDYAHTPSSFETIFPPIKKRCTGRIFAVFGSGGERDLTKRPLQGQIAAKFCDVIVLADEDPRGEDPETLLKQIAVGAQKQGKILNENLFIIPDRKKAIQKVFSMAQKGDIVLLLGKSHENSIIYKDYVMPYDEISQAKLTLNQMGFTE